MINGVIPGMVRTAQFAKEFSLFLFVGAACGLLWANVAHHSYHDFQHSHLFAVGDVEVTTHFLINDILMTLFFAIAAKEVWEALLPGGKLHGFRKAATPLMATLGGIVMPACVYLGCAWMNQDLSNVHKGWGITVATDIAFAILFARAIFGSGHPAIAFLLLLAIADDAGGLAILAVFYPQGDLQPIWFLLALAGVGIGFGFQRLLLVHNFWWYLLIPGVLSWVGFFKAGIHPALGLIPIIPTMPHAKSDLGIFVREEYGLQDTLNRFEHWWAHPVELILGLFGLVNAGVVISQYSPVTGYIIAGLVIGKPLGVCLFTLIGVKLLRLELPAGIKAKDIVVIGAIAGIGFTVALFMSLAAFPPGEVQDAAKMGALASFGAAGVAGLLAFILGVGRFARTTTSEGVTELTSQSTKVPVEE